MDPDSLSGLPSGPEKGAQEPSKDVPLLPPGPDPQDAEQAAFRPNLAVFQPRFIPFGVRSPDVVLDVMGVPR